MELSLALIWPLLLGAVLGGVGGLLGIGGGIIAIPVLALGFGMSQQLAQGTALVMIMPNVLLAFWRYYQRHPMPLATVGLLGACAMLATGPAAWLAIHLDSRILGLCFAIFLIGLAFYFLHGARAAAPVEMRSAGWHPRLMPGVGLAGGFMSGLFGVGAGLVVAPMLVRGFGLRQAVAQGMGLATVVPGSVLALATFAQAKQVDWPTGTLLAVGGMATISYGVGWAHRLPEKKLRRLFALMLLATATLMIARAAFAAA